MSRMYSDPTANAAIGSIDREINRMTRKAERLKELKQKGRLTPEHLAQARREFTGIFRPLLWDVLDS